MISIIDLIKEDNYEPKGYKSRIKKINPETNSITWSIKPNDIKVIDSKLEDIQYRLERLANNREDVNLDKLIATFKRFKRAYRSHITRKYK